jgi:3-oxoacyl-[acyl-carrier protein] reductase
LAIGLPERGSEQPMRFTDKVAIVTGAGGGLGAAYAAALAREGASVVVTDIAADRVAATAERIKASGGRALAVASDLTDVAQVEDMVRQAMAGFGRIDVLVNNAGGGSSSPGNASSVIDTTPDAWDTMLRINLANVFLCIRAVTPIMKAQRYGRIENVSSRSARVADPKLLQSPSYAAAKTAVLSLTRFSARELGPFGITVNCMVPALVLSGPVLEEYWERLGEPAREEYLSQVALRRLPRIEEVADVILFLASDQSSYITGAAIDVNGGSFMPA